jgi:hypothetical protein
LRMCNEVVRIVEERGGWIVCVFIRVTSRWAGVFHCTTLDEAIAAARRMRDYQTRVYDPRVR